MLNADNWMLDQYLEQEGMAQHGGVLKMDAEPWTMGNVPMPW